MVTFEFTALGTAVAEPFTKYGVGAPAGRLFSTSCKSATSARSVAI